jgi:DEAD/DEAH box helicase domain-containing protein
MTDTPVTADRDDTDRESRDDSPGCDPVSTDGGTAPDAPGRPVLSEATLETTYPDYRGQVRHTERLDARDARTVPAGDVLPTELAARLDVDLFTHQAEALDHLADGEDVVVTTSTSSGKTWIYALRAARDHLEDPDSTALCLYPTKALARDQEGTLNDKLRGDWNLDLQVGVYDGDTDSDRKRRIRREADVILTNPAGLNAYLPRHDRDRGWHRFYAGLELVVIDEGHEYSGVTGTHVAFVLRRLQRLLDAHGADPQFVVTTATIGNPAEHARRLTGGEFRVVDEDGSPRGARDVVLWEPPLEGEIEAGATDPLADFEQARASTGSEAASVTAHLAVNGVQTLQFCTARQGTEIAARQISRAASAHPADGDVETDPYHAGLGKQARRAVENRLEAGAVDAVPTTNALELGIDIGSVDATVAAGYPGTRQSFWQQVGRAGRGATDALSVLVGGMDAMDAYIFEHPDYLFGDGSVEDAVVSVDNDRMYADHLLAAAAERPLRAGDAAYLGDERRLREVTAMWQDAGLLERAGSLDAGGVTYTGDRRPQGRLSLYGVGNTEFRVVCENGEIDHDPVARERACRDYHEGALFLHAGRQYEVSGVDEAGHHPTITVRETETDEYTQTTSTKSVTDLSVRDHTSLAGDYDLYFGEGTVRITYDSYLVRNVFTGEVVRGPVPTGAPALDLRTELLWVALPPDHLRATIDRLDAPLLQPTDRSERDAAVPTAPEVYTYGGGLHAAEHGVIGLAPLELLIDDADVGGLSTPSHPHETVPGPTWFVHDGVDGGIGFSKAIYEQFAALAERTREHIGDCDCGRRRGCPMCVMSEHCGNNNDPLDTLVGGLILDDVLEAFRDA